MENSNLIESKKQFLRTTSPKDQPSQIEVFSTSKSTIVNKELNSFESDNSQSIDIINNSKPSYIDLRNLITFKKCLKKEHSVSRSLNEKFTSNIWSYRKKNNDTCITKPTECNNSNTESVKSSAKKYPSLCIILSKSLNRKVLVQNFDLDDIITGNIDNDNMHKPKYNESDIKEEQNHCGSLLKQITPSSMELGGVDNGFEFECEALLSLINKIKENNVDRSEIKDSGSESDADIELDDVIVKKEHPNRRLQTERPMKNLDPENRKCRTRTKRKLSTDRYHGEKKRKTSILSSEDKKVDGSEVYHQSKNLKWISNFTTVSNNKQINSVVGKNPKHAEFWSEVLSTPELWKTESNKIDISIFRQVKLEINYQELLNGYISYDSDKKLYSDCLTYWETKFQEKLNNTQFLLEFYIPPARVELFHLQLTDELSCVECLHKVCENRQWAQPVYKQIPQSDPTSGFLYSCQLKSVQFTPSKAASNHQLAQELAADMCLEWLGLRPRRTS